MRLLILVFLSFCLVADVDADDYESIVQQAFENNKRTSDDEWAYTIAITAEDVTQIQRFDPRLAAGERWALISVDGVPPTSREHKEFLKEKAETDDSESDDEVFGADFVTPGSLELVEETDTEYRFRFQPNSKEGSEDAEFMRHVSGELSVNKKGLFVESFGLKSAKPFKPEKGVKISRFELSMEFGPAIASDHIVFLSVSVRIAGRAYFMFKIDEAQEAVYSDYERVAGLQEDE